MRLSIASVCICCMIASMLIHSATKNIPNNIQKQADYKYQVMSYDKYAEERNRQIRLRKKAIPKHRYRH